MKRLDVVHITWLDSQSEGEWRDIESLDDHLEVTHTIGILVKETPNTVVLALSYDPQTNHVHSAKHIPHIAIIDWKLICSIPMN